MKTYCTARKKTQQNSNSVRFQSMPSASTAAEVRQAGETQPCSSFLGWSGAHPGCLSLALGLMKPSDLVFNSLFFEKRKAALMEAFKIPELWISLLRQTKVDSFK